MEQLTIAKVRKEMTITVKVGDYIILAQPGQPYDSHLAHYRKAASKAPVNDDYSRVCIGQLRHTNPVLNLVTKDEKVKLDEAEEKRNDSIEEIVMSAPLRQKSMQEEQQAKKDEEHKKRIAEKNKLIEQIKKDTARVAV